MGARGETIQFSDFSGGLDTFNPEILSNLNTSPDLQNINLLDKAFEKRRGDVAFNSSAMVSGSTPVVGLGYIKFTSGTEFLNSIAGTKFFSSSGLSGTMSDVTGAITITSGQDNIWTPVIYNDLQIWFGGAPDAPFKYSGSGNAAALGGSPPSAATAFVANNRIFAISTVANPSIIQWPILSNPEDWTGTGSGNALVSKNDGEALQCGIVLNSDTAILFKNSSSHLMILTSAPFPIYQLQKGIGVAGRRAAINVRGEIYLVTPGRRMKSTTDGINFKNYPQSIDDIWDSINTNRISNIVGQYYQKLEQVHWYVSTGTSTSNNYCIIWDLRRQCWLRHTTGFKVNVSTLIQNYRLFAGHYDGMIYEKDKTATYTDASVASPSIIDAYWRTPFKPLGSFASTIHPIWADFACLSDSTATLDVSYGFDFSSPQTTQTFSLQTSGSLWDVSLWDVATWSGANSIINRIFVYGRGNVFSMTFRNANASQYFQFQGATLQLRTDKARKLIQVA